MGDGMGLLPNVLASLALICMSGLFSGLTLGLLGLDPVNLEIVAKGDTNNARYAQLIQPVRAKGNLLLCTLLIGNVAVNSALSIIMAEIAGGLSGFLISTTAITIFGEILPQAACSRYALYIGSKVIWLVKILVMLIWPLAYPISKVLDWMLGDELGMVYTNRELQNLVEIHKRTGQLQGLSAGIMQGALDFSKLAVENVMTKWEDAFILSVNSKLDFETLELIFKSGHSRIPIWQNMSGTQRHNSESSIPHAGARHTEYKTVVGLLFVKDLILLDPEDELPIRNIIDTFRHDLKQVDVTMSVTEILDDFRHGRSHLAIVRKKTAKTMNGEPVFENVGIVTLEDIIENILRLEIEDEFDVVQKSTNTAREARKEDILQLFDYRRTRGMDGMPPQEKIVVFRHLCREVKVFMPEYRRCDDQDLTNLLASGTVYKVLVDDWPPDPNHEPEAKSNVFVEDGGFLLYKSGVKSEFFTFILDGKAEVFSGRQKFRSEVSRFTILAPHVLENTQRDFEEHLEMSDFVPDFTARVIQNSRILRLSRAKFLKCLSGKLRHYRRPTQDTRARFDTINVRRSTTNVWGNQGGNRLGENGMFDSYPSEATLRPEGLQRKPSMTRNMSAPGPHSYQSAPNISRSRSGGSQQPSVSPPLGTEGVVLDERKTDEPVRRRFYDDSYQGHGLGGGREVGVDNKDLESRPSRPAQQPRQYMQESDPRGPPRGQNVDERLGARVPQHQRPAGEQGPPPPAISVVSPNVTAHPAVAMSSMAAQQAGQGAQQQAAGSAGGNKPPASSSPPPFPTDDPEETTNLIPK